MMMETVVYSREYLFVKELYDKGELGRIQFLRGSHQQDMDGWPGYWPGLPPMYYATHCVSPCLALLGQARRERRLPRLGPDSRGADPEVRQPVRHRDGDVQDQGLATSCAEVTRSLFDTARQYRESFDAYGSKKSLRVAAGRGRGAGDPHEEHGRCREPEIPKRVKVPDYAHLLPEPIRRFTQPAAIQDADHLSFLQGGGHGGSHPHLVHNFLMAVPRRAAGLARRRDLAPTGRWSASAPTSRR